MIVPQVSQAPGGALLPGLSGSCFLWCIQNKNGTKSSACQAAHTCGVHRMYEVYVHRYVPMYDSYPTWRNEQVFGTLCLTL